LLVLIAESAPASLRGELSKWMLEPKAGVFVGRVSAAVRDLLWEKACREVAEGGVTLIYRTNNEQGFAIRSFGDTSRQIEQWEGLFLVRRPNPPEVGDPSANEAAPANPMDWSAMCHPVIWAKSPRGVELAEGEPTWHPLVCHMIDSAMVALRLWKHLLPPSVKEQMRASLGAATLEEAGRWIALFVGLHDLGKANPGFALKWEEGAERLLDQGFKPGKRRESSPHGFVSAHLLEEILVDLGLDIESAVAIGLAVGGHHGIFPSPLDMEPIPERTGGKRWREAQRQLTLVLAHILEVDGASPPGGKLLENVPFMMLLAGLTSVADWIASNHRYFPFAGDGVTLPEYPKRARRRASRALIDLGWFHRPALIEAKPFGELFSFLSREMKPNRLQTELIEISEKLKGPSLVLLEYPMGGGKTEGALYLANTLHASTGQQGLYVALPTMATSNQMFDRVSEYLSNRFPGVRINLQLLHGRADLNPSFARLLNREGDLPPAPVIEEEGNSDKARLVAAEWFTHRKQSLLAPFGIGTVDQLLLAGLETKHYFVRLFGLAGKVVVVDEVHAYDTYMQTLLGHLLTWLAACGSSVILLSATLPAATRQDLLMAYAAGRGESGTFSQVATPYPRVTWLSEGKAGARSIAGTPSRSVALRGLEAQENDWMLALKERLEAGGCAAVLCNTVGRAQEVYRELTAFFPEDELILFHARFPFDDRMERETAVLRRFGKESAERPFRMVCVATQVIEQSLDIDFDLMVSELAPVDLVLQRSGRVWRHERPDRPGHLHGPELWMLLPPISEEGVPLFDRASTYVYEAHLLLRSYLVLRDQTTLVVPEGVEGLIESVYHKASPPEGLAPAIAVYWEETAKRLFAASGRDRRKAAVRETPAVDADLVDHRPMALDEDSGEIHEAHQAMTRLGGLSVEVVCLYARGGQIFLTADATAPFRLDRRPDRDGVRALLGRSLRLSFDLGLVKQILELEVPPEWEVTAHLRRYRLLLFDPDGFCITADLPLKLDPVLGFQKHLQSKEANK